MLKNSSILITGGTGSFGHNFVPMTLKKYNPKIIDTPAIGTTLILVKPMEQRFKLSLNK